MSQLELSFHKLILLIVRYTAETLKVILSLTVQRLLPENLLELREIYWSIINQIFIFLWSVVPKWPEYYRVECFCFSQASFFFYVMYVGKIFLSCHCNVKCTVDDNIRNFFWQGLLLYNKNHENSKCTFSTACRLYSFSGP